ncbi:hypothetical protein chiPu_0025122 [Chiloscyllium punctatum]|uniref:Uncharacterized protein n=1 Tax=Chiloscyllium punctatum TaxID=137246 RepID=A0A401TEQ2_CHIPU|nr:hypothetical protein [Chiloscyllium punctatum]
MGATSHGGDPGLQKCSSARDAPAGRMADVLCHGCPVLTVLTASFPTSPPLPADIQVKRYLQETERCLTQYHKREKLMYKEMFAK